MFSITPSPVRDSPGRGVEEFVMFIIRLTPLVDITVLLNDIVFRQKVPLNEKSTFVRASELELIQADRTCK